MRASSSRCGTRPRAGRCSAVASCATRVPVPCRRSRWPAGWPAATCTGCGTAPTCASPDPLLPLEVSDMVMQDATWSPTDNKVSIQIAYWSAQLDGAVPTELPVDPAAGSDADPEPVGFEVPAGRLLELAERYGVGTRDLALAALHLTLARYLGQADVTVALAGGVGRHAGGGGAADRGVAVAGIEGVGAPAGARLFGDWIATDRPIATRTLPDLLSAAVAERAGWTAVWSDDGRLTFAELDAAANRLARLLIRLGAGPERVVALLLPRSVRIVVAQLAVAKTGAAFLPVGPGN